VANFGVSSVTEYAAGAFGAAPPVVTIAGSNTGLKGPEMVVVDASGDLFVTNAGGMTEYTAAQYAPGGTLNITAAATITGLNGPVGIALSAATSGGATGATGATGPTGPTGPAAHRHHRHRDYCDYHTPNFRFC
jgi:DNA-binding beta-propeller fold protein YncE